MSSHSSTHGIEAEFLQSVFPVVSSSKTSKIIIVSTPNGMGNEFYRLWNRATLNIDENVDNANRWHYTKVDWFEVPGRDENWKQKQLETFGNNLKKFDQEYGCSFLGSSDTLVDSDILKTYKEKFMKSHVKGADVQLHKDFPKTKIKMFYPPIANHAYVVRSGSFYGLRK